MSLLRSCYLLLPATLTIVALVLVILTFIDQLSLSSSVLSTLHFLKVDTGAFTLADDVGVDVADYYTIGLWNYCTGNADQAPNYCSPAKAFFYFNPVEVWNLESLPIDSLAPKEWQDGLATYKAVSKWMFIAYIVSLALLGLTTLFGALTFCMSRGSSFFTTLVAGLAAIVTIAASGTATGLFLVIKGLLEDKLGKYGVSATLGSTLFIYTWVASGLALIASVAWMFSCCCGGEHKQKRARTENVYARVPSPYAHATAPPPPQGYYSQQAPMSHAPKGTAYEPYRHNDRV